jgi:hypothetical protein
VTDSGLETRTRRRFSLLIPRRTRKPILDEWLALLSQVDNGDRRSVSAGSNCFSWLAAE